MNKEWIESKMSLIAELVKNGGKHLKDNTMVFYAIREGMKPLSTLWEMKGSGYLSCGFFPLDSNGLYYRISREDEGVVLCKNMIPICRYDENSQSVVSIENEKHSTLLLPEKKSNEKLKMSTKMRKMLRKKKERESRV